MTAQKEWTDNYVSYSSLVTHRSCPQRYKYAYLDKFTKAEADAHEVARDLGTWWHALRAADSIERGRALETLQWLPEQLSGPDQVRIPAETVTMTGVLGAVADWWHRMPADKRDIWTGQLGETPCDRLLYLNARWQEEWAASIAEEEPLAVELKWRRELPGQKQADGSMLPTNTVAGGYVDEVYYDRRRAMVVARDWKLLGKLGSQTAYDDMMDSQLQFYAWGAAPTVAEWGRGSIRVLAYDRACAAKPATPQVTQTGLLSKSVTQFDLTTYLAWAVGEDGLGVPWGEEGKEFASGPRKGQPKFGRYTAEEQMIEKLSTPAWRSLWFQRTLTPLNRNLVLSHLRAAVDSALDVQRTKARVEVAGEAQRNFSRGCNWCEYNALCRTEMVAGPGGEYDLIDFGLRVKDDRDKR